VTENKNEFHIGAESSEASGTSTEDALKQAFGLINAIVHCLADSQTKQK